MSTNSAQTLHTAQHSHPPLNVSDDEHCNAALPVYGQCHELIMLVNVNLHAGKL